MYYLCTMCIGLWPAAPRNLKKWPMANFQLETPDVTPFYISWRLICIKSQVDFSVDSGAEFPVIITVCKFQSSEPSRHSVLINKCLNCFAPVSVEINSLEIELFCASDKFKV